MCLAPVWLASLVAYCVAGSHGLSKIGELACCSCTSMLVVSDMSFELAVILRKEIDR